MAKEMALGALMHVHALDPNARALAFSITGVAGPTGGSPAKPVGTVWMGIAYGMPSNERVLSVLRHFEGDRSMVRLQAVLQALIAANWMIQERAQ